MQGRRGTGSQARAPRKGDGQKSFHITSPLLGLRCPSSTHAHAHKVPGSPSLLERRVYEAEAEPEPGDEATGAETPPYLTGIATEADFPLELPRAVLPLSQSIRVWVTGRKPGSSGSHTCHSPGMQVHLQILSRAMSRSPSASHTLPHAQAAIHCLSLWRKLMGWPGFQVSGDGIQVGFQDFKSLMDLLVLNPPIRAGAQVGGLRAQKRAEVPELRAGWGNQFFLEAAHLPKGMDSGARKSRSDPGFC